jgi:hypothetical protein
MVEPCAQGLAPGGVARGWKASLGGAPVQRAIEALDEVVGQADTDDPCVIRFFFRQRFSSFFSKHDTMEYRALSEVETWGMPRGGFTRKNPVGFSDHWRKGCVGGV